MNVGIKYDYLISLGMGVKYIFVEYDGVRWFRRFKIINQESIYIEIHKYIQEKDIKIEAFDDMKECIMNMMKDGSVL